MVERIYNKLNTVPEHRVQLPNVLLAKSQIQKVVLRILNPEKYLSQQED
jgi:hypothetical protein